MLGFTGRRDAGRSGFPIAPARCWRMIEIKKDQDVYREGTFARALGRPSDSNPYPADAREKALWDMGWCMIDESRAGTTRPRAASQMKSVPDFGPGVVSLKDYRRRRRQPSPEVQSARLRALKIVVVIAASALMLAMLWLAR